MSEQDSAPLDPPEWLVRFRADGVVAVRAADSWKAIDAALEKVHALLRWPITYDHEVEVTEDPALTTENP